ncbi:MAG: SDR family oxidoreductase [Gemmatimonadaceae bacterium]
MTPPLAGRIAVVTGASRGIGAAVAHALAGAGARLVLLARAAQRLGDLARALPGSALPLAADLANESEVARAVAVIRAEAGLPDVVVNNAGAFALGRVGTLPLGEVERMIDVNLLAPYRLLHDLVPPMRARGSGHLVTIGSIADHAAYPENAGYAASKFGARAVHEVLRHELRGTGLRATLVSPGPVDTDMWDPIRPETRPGFPSREQMLRPEDVAEAVLWSVTRPAHVNVDEVQLARA